MYLRRETKKDSSRLLGIMVYSFQMLSSSLLYGYTTVGLIHQSKDIWVVSSLTVMNKTAINICGQFLCEPKFSFFLGKYLGMGLLIHIHLPIILHAISYPGASDYVTLLFVLDHNRGCSVPHSSIRFLYYFQGNFRAGRET